MFYFKPGKLQAQSKLQLVTGQRLSILLEGDVPERRTLMLIYLMYNEWMTALFSLAYCTNTLTLFNVPLWYSVWNVKIKSSILDTSFLEKNSLEMSKLKTDKAEVGYALLATLEAIWTVINHAVKKDVCTTLKTLS